MRGRPFSPGNQMGRGRPRGSKNRRTLFMKAIEEHGESIIKTCTIQALKGDPTALRLCMERLIPPSRSSGPRFQFPTVNSADDLGTAFQALLKQTAQGRIKPRDAEAMAGVLETRRRLAETEEMNSRLKAVEEKVAKDLRKSENEH